MITRIDSESIRTVSITQKPIRRNINKDIAWEISRIIRASVGEYVSHFEDILNVSMFKVSDDS